MTGAKRLKGTPVLWRLGDTAPNGPHVAVVPGTQVPLLPLALPDRLRGMARERVAARQLVEQLSLPADGFEMHPYTGKGAKLWSAALIADAAAASAWRKALRPGCIALLPDYLTLPTAPGVWSIEVKGGLVAARLGPEDGFAAEPDLALAMLAEAPLPKAVLRLGTAEAALDAWLATLKAPIHTDVAGLKKAGYSPLRWLDATGGVDLKDPPSALYDRLRAKIMRWRVPVVFAVLALGIWMATMALETRRYRAESNRDQARMTALVREHFVTSGPILDVRAQVSAAMAEATDSVQTEAAVLPPLTQFQIAAPALTTETARLISASFRSDTGLVTTVEASDFAALDQLVAALQGAGFLVQQLDSRAQQSGGVVARLRLDLLS